MSKFTTPIKRAKKTITKDGKIKNDLSDWMRESNQKERRKDLKRAIFEQQQKERQLSEDRERVDKDFSRMISQAASLAAKLAKYNPEDAVTQSDVPMLVCGLKVLQGRIDKWLNPSPPRIIKGIAVEK